MIDNIERIGNFTSSNVYRLCASTVKGEVTAAFYTYVQEKMFERSLGRSLEMGAYSQAMSWGSFLEKRVNDNLGNAYIMVHKQTNVHPVHKFWTGSPDFDCPTLGKIAELKCFEPKNFASYVTALLSEDLDKIKKEHPKEYWQIVSNACIKGYSKGEAIVYMPYQSEMKQIKELAEDPDYLAEIGMEPWQVRFIVEKENSQLATLPDNSKFKNLNIFEFEIPIEDKIFLTKRIMDANKLITGCVIVGDNGTSPRIDTLEQIVNPAWPDTVKLFITQDPAWPANTIMGWDQSYGYHIVNSSTLTYEAVQNYLIRRSSVFRYDRGSIAYRLFDEAWSVLTLTL